MRGVAANRKLARRLRWSRAWTVVLSGSPRSPTEAARGRACRIAPRTRAFLDRRDSLELEAAAASNAEKCGGRGGELYLKNVGEAAACLDYAEVELSNNVAENSLRPVAVEGRTGGT